MPIVHPPRDGDTWVDEGASLAMATIAAAIGETEPVDLALPVHGVSADQVAAARSGQKDA